MCRREFIAHLRGQGCELLREGAKHSVFFNHLARKICHDLEITTTKKK